MLSTIRDTIRRSFLNQRYLGMIGIFSLGILTAIAGLIVIVADLVSLALSAIQSVIVMIAHSHPLVQVTLLLLAAYAIKRSWPALKSFFWRLSR
jgi:hypothetical protein